jgi:hypothetical protein
MLRCYYTNLKFCILKNKKLKIVPYMFECSPHSTWSAKSYAPGTHNQGLKMWSIFLKITEIRWDRPGPNLKIADFWNSNSENFEKKSGKLSKKTRSNSKNIGGEIFSNLDHFVG